METGFKDVKHGITGIGCWILLLIGAFILKGGFDTAKADGWFKEENKVDKDKVNKDKMN